MSGVDVIAYALTIAALAALTLLGLRVWRQTPERVTARGLAGTAALTAVSAPLAAAAENGWALMFADKHPHAGGPQTYAAYLSNTDGHEVELTASNP